MELTEIISLIGGLTFFLYGMNMLSGGLEKMAGGKLEKILRKVTKNPLMGLVFGAGITVALQSSSAITVMLVGLVNSGVMQFSQTLGVIFGANIGTTITAWLTGLMGIDSGDNPIMQLLKPQYFSLLIAFVGIVFVMMSKKDKRKNIGTVFVGFGVLMTGMAMMSGAMKGLQGNPEFLELLGKFDHPVIGVLIGLVVTAVLQSSAASVAMLQSLAMTGGISFGMAIPIVMGQNIGTCATALISCIGTNSKAKRVAVVHTLVNVIGTAICMSAFFGLNAIFNWAFVDMTVSTLDIATFHSIFNITITLMLMPFSKLLVKLTELLVKDKKEKGAKDEAHVFIDERLLRSPSVAIAECNNASNKMCELATDTMYKAMGLFEKFDNKTAEQILTAEEDIDRYEDELSTYLVKLSSLSVSDNDAQVISKILHAVGDFERLGDHAVNIVKVAQELDSKGIFFTEQAKSELRVLMAAIDEILATTEKAYVENDLELAKKVEPLEQVIDSLTSKIKSSHITRLQSGTCSIEMGFILSDVLTNLERISDHCSNIAVAIIEVSHNSFDTHKYLSGVKVGNSSFNELHDHYKAKYHF